MKRPLLVLLFALTAAFRSFAQLPDGSTAPDFTFTDLGGTTHHLYDYLNAGKYVAIEVSATWCHPCWLYHNTHSMDTLYYQHDLPGDQAWKVLFIEGDGTTTDADVHGTTGSSQGDWTTGTSFPILNPSGIALNDFKAGYNITMFPTLFMICPNKKIIQEILNGTPRGMISTWNDVAGTPCAFTGIDDIRDSNPLTIYPNPAKDKATLYFSLNKAANISVTVADITGKVVSTHHYKNLYPGDQQLPVDVSGYTAGMYFFTIATDNGRTIRKKVIVQ